MFNRFGTDDQKADASTACSRARSASRFGLTEPNHGSDATFMETRAVQRGDDVGLADQRREDVEHRHARRDRTTCLRPHLGQDGDARGITCFLVPAKTPGFKIEEYMWTFNMPTDHPRSADQRVGAGATRCWARSAAG